MDNIYIIIVYVFIDVFGLCLSTEFQIAAKVYKFFVSMGRSLKELFINCIIIIYYTLHFQ